MGNIKRQTLKFLVPTSLTAVKSSDLTDRTIIPVYINPNSIRIQDSKLIESSPTKGGYMTQYWGEALSILEISGTTGSGGIEAIHILRDVYRHEQIQFHKLLLERAALLSASATEEITNTSTSNVQSGIVSAIDELLNGGFRSISDGIKSTIESISDAFNSASTSSVKVELFPTIAAFAVSIDLYFQGEKFRGYFKNFNVDENAESPGLFDYSFTFEVIKRSGRRKNFMPWHRTPYDFSGNPITASIPVEGARPEELTFDATNIRSNSIVGSRFVTSSFANGQEGVKEKNNVGVSRLNKVKS